MSLVTVVIPNYNGFKFLKPCFDSLMKQSMEDFEIIFVDNASADESVEYVKKEYPNVIIIVSDKNYGFSHAVNIGIKAANSPYVILLNNDTESDKDYIKNMYGAISSDDGIFSCSCKMINYNNRDIMDDAGDLYSIIGWQAQRGVGRKVEKYNKQKNVFSSCAGAAIYNKKVFDEIGYFDEEHFAYFEDIDIGYRARIFGYKNIYIPDAIVYHVGSGTSGSKYNEFKVKLSSRNSIYLIYKNMPLLQIIFNFLPLLFGFFVKYLFFRKKGFKEAYISGVKEGIKSCNKEKHVKFKFSNLFNYIKIEFELILNTFKYISEFILRRIS